MQQNNPHHPKVMVWGAGRSSRKRFATLADHGIEVTHWIDIDPKKIGQKPNGVPVISYRELPQPGQTFILCMVGKRGVREEIEENLARQNYKPTIHYICAS